ncbi:membrane fusion protein, copper/silver efflux system [Methylomarinovum caldicuralii]|uniref:Membrane fusion protein, copper/silver efflux system n=1 Tax=Methylomarinovum caldicuralii TaxID=438856 RepID=A0AAU9C927_9GAMM|nr:efflux RND transporter periplasmic adaptor subunit [Methylomarinovum caldicuralii]BCX80974.1 membrane fusion protein, copper/silver efflux system [Methylomarinovum caldicuralii]
MPWKWIAIVLIALSVGLGSGYRLASRQPETATSVSAGGCEPMFYRHPMNPAITSKTPAKDEMGMDYIPVYPPGCPGAAAEASGPPGTVVIDPTVVQTIGVRTAKVVRRDFSHPIHTVGRVSYDEDLLARLHPKTEGWIEKLYVSDTGAFVARDAMLLSLYSPQLVASEQEYLLALKSLRLLKDSPFKDISRGARQLVKSARERLELLDVPEHQILELERSGRIMKSLHIHSPFDGYVVHIGVREGQYVTPQTELYLIADLSKVWVYADIYEYELPWVRVGDPAEITLTAVPGRVFHGQVVYVYPYADPKTRTIKVRLEFDNPDLTLKPELFANATLHTRPKTGVLAISSEAVVRTGLRDHVFVVKGPGRFEPRIVELGVPADGWVEVLAGLSEGEEVVVSSQFLIDSESRLQEALSKFTEPARQKMEKMPGMKGMDGMQHGGSHD